MTSPGKTHTDPVLARHRQASHEYAILETFEAGIQLSGTEVKALRQGHVQLREGYVRIENGEAWLLQVHIGQYAKGSWTNHDPTQRRRLLLHKKEIVHLDMQVRQGGLTLIPLKIYVTRNKIKLAFGLCRGKKLWDKRHDIAARDASREAERIAGRARKGGL